MTSQDIQKKTVLLEINLKNQVNNTFSQTDLYLTDLFKDSTLAKVENILTNEFLNHFQTN